MGGARPPPAHSFDAVWCRFLALDQLLPTQPSQSEQTYAEQGERHWLRHPILERQIAAATIDVEEGAVKRGDRRGGTEIADHQVDRTGRRNHKEAALVAGAKRLSETRISLTRRRANVEGLE